MRKLLHASFAVLGLAGLLATAAGQAATGPGQIRITDVQKSYRVIRATDGGLVGSVEIVRQTLFNTKVTSRAIGQATMTCTYTDQRTRSCNGAYLLPKGQLVVSGVISTRLLYEIAVVGGTGIYESAHGTLTVTSTHLRPRREVLLFRLAG